MGVAIGIAITATRTGWPKFGTFGADRFFATSTTQSGFSSFMTSAEPDAFLALNF